MRSVIVTTLLLSCLGCRADAPSSDPPSLPPSPPFPSSPLPPVPDADPTDRSPKEFEVPTRLLVDRSEERVSIAVDRDTTESVSLEVGKNMLTGYRQELTVKSAGATVLSGIGSLSGALDVGTTYLHRGVDGVPRPGERCVVETRFTLFETDIPPQHRWSPESGQYKVLWRRTLRCARE